MEYTFEYQQQQFYPVTESAINQARAIKYFPKPLPLQQIPISANSFDEAESLGKHMILNLNEGSIELDVIYAAVVSKNHKKREIKPLKIYQFPENTSIDHKVIKLEDRLRA